MKQAEKAMAIGKLTRQLQSMDINNWTVDEKNAVQEGPPGTKLLAGPDDD